METSLTAQRPGRTVPPDPFAVVRSFDDVQRTASLLVASGYFSDVRDIAQAGAKILAGLELGIPPMAAISGIYIQQGKTCLSAGLIANLIRRHPRYDYRISRLDDSGCVLTFYIDAHEAGDSSFSRADAEQAGLLAGKNRHNYEKYPRNMFFARAISNGARWHCPDVFGGATVYVPEEMDEIVDGETGEVISIKNAPEHAEEHGAPGRAPGNVPSPPVQSASPGSAEVKTRSRPPRSAISKGSPVTQEMVERLQAAARDAGLTGAEWTTHLRRFGADEAAGLLQEEWQQACDMLRREPYREHLRRETIARLIWENISIASAQNLPGQRQGWMQRIDRVYPEDDPTRDESRAGLYEVLDEAVRERAEALGVTLKTTAQL